MKTTTLVACLSAALMTSLAVAKEPETQQTDTHETHTNTSVTDDTTLNGYTANESLDDESLGGDSINDQSAVTSPDSTQTLTTIGANSEAIAILTAVNDHEVKSAEMALAKNPSAAVAEYAQMLQDEHASNQEKTVAIADEGGIAGKGTPAVDELIAKSKAKREELAALHTDAFETAFIIAMVRDHAEVLARIDNELLPKATDPKVLQHLRDTRTHIAMHLEMARKLDGSRQASR